MTTRVNTSSSVVLFQGGYVTTSNITVELSEHDINYQCHARNPETGETSYSHIELTVMCEYNIIRKNKIQSIYIYQYLGIDLMCHYNARWH